MGIHHPSMLPLGGLLPTAVQTDDTILQLGLQEDSSRPERSCGVQTAKASWYQAELTEE